MRKHNARFAQRGSMSPMGWLYQSAASYAHALANSKAFHYSANWLLRAVLVRSKEHVFKRGTLGGIPVKQVHSVRDTCQGCVFLEGPLCQRPEHDEMAGFKPCYNVQVNPTTGERLSTIYKRERASK